MLRFVVASKVLNIYISMSTKALIEWKWRFIEDQLSMRFNNMWMQDGFVLLRHFGKYFDSTFTDYIPLSKDYRSICPIVIKCDIMIIKELQMC
jgi:hypothetical protein